MASNRHLGRIVALQTLYEEDFRREVDDPSLKPSEVLSRNISRYEETHGAQFETYATQRIRGAMLDEQLEAMKAAWGNTPAAYAGRHFRFSDVYLEPKPFRSDGPRMWFGGQSLHPALLRRLVTPITPSVDSSKPAIDRRFKTGHHGRGGRDQWSSTSPASRCASRSGPWCASFEVRI